MRVEDLSIDELVELDPEDGVIRFAGQRALLLDAAAMGLLRKYLVENFGLTAARTVLTQFGFAHGWRMAEAMQAEFKWDSDEDWRPRGRIHMLEGLFRVEAGHRRSAVEGGRDARRLVRGGAAHRALRPLRLPRVLDHLRPHERLPQPGNGQGDLRPRGSLHGQGRRGLPPHRAHARGVGRRARRGAALLRVENLKECLDVSLHRVTETLKAAERKLRETSARWSAWRATSRSRWGSSPRAPRCGELVDLARRVAKVDSTVLITGESGSGKERIARLVHEESTRAAGPFIAVNCGAITETLLESELFGHARGAFTGATQDRPGLFEAANGGTLLLDEVGEVSPGMQVKLLRALQEREIRRVGENKSRPVDVRVVAATNRDLAHGVAGGPFRQDLYYRLKVVELHVPPLRERRDDILPLARVLLARRAARMKRKITGPRPAPPISSCATSGRATCASWRTPWSAPSRSRAEVAWSSRTCPRRSARRSRRRRFRGPVRPLDEVEKEYILAALELNGGNQTRTAEQLRIGSATLYRKLKSYGVVPGAAPRKRGCCPHEVDMIVEERFITRAS